MRRDDGLVLAVQRPDEPGEELPGVWGLPAATLVNGEAHSAAVARIGREKLGAALTLVRLVGAGEQDRPSNSGRKGYTLRMTVYAASLSGEARLPQRDASSQSTQYTALDWLPDESFREAASRGSLCCQVLLEALALPK